jgi:hypothetical protein
VIDRHETSARQTVPFREIRTPYQSSFRRRCTQRFESVCEGFLTSRKRGISQCTG